MIPESRRRVDDPQLSGISGALPIPDSQVIEPESPAPETGCHRCGPEASRAITRGAVSVCNQCGATSCGDRPAVYADLEALAPDDIADLTRQRRRVVPHRKKSAL